MIVICTERLLDGQTGLRHRHVVNGADASHRMSFVAHRRCGNPSPPSRHPLHLDAASDTRRRRIHFFRVSPVSDLAFHLILFLFVAGFVAGFIDSIAGGGGMITIPAMLIAGIPPLETLGTNKLQSLFGSGSASLSYARHGHVNLKEQLPMALMSALGS
ncbi:MAG TPA: TSUP family transporter, partial [Sinorhizobium sp.]|nr:TSUP family transporter [Sinorhizobium sp.]